MQQIPISHLPIFPDIIILDTFLVLLLFQCLHYVRKVSWANTERARVWISQQQMQMYVANELSLLLGTISNPRHGVRPVSHNNDPSMTSMALVRQTTSAPILHICGYE